MINEIRWPGSFRGALLVCFSLIVFTTAAGHSQEYQAGHNAGSTAGEEPASTGPTTDTIFRERVAKIKDMISKGDLDSAWSECLGLVENPGRRRRDLYGIGILANLAIRLAEDGEKRHDLVRANLDRIRLSLSETSLGLEDDLAMWEATNLRLCVSLAIAENDINAAKCDAQDAAELVAAYDASYIRPQAAHEDTVRALLRDLVVLGLHEEALAAMRTQWPLLHGVRREKRSPSGPPKPVSKLSADDFEDGTRAVINALAHVELAEELHARDEMAAAARFYVRGLDLIARLRKTDVEWTPELTRAENVCRSALHPQTGCAPWAGVVALVDTSHAKPEPGRLQHEAIAKKAAESMNRLVTAMIDGRLDDALQETRGTEKDKESVERAIHVIESTGLTDYEAKAKSVRELDTDEPTVLVELEVRCVYEGGRTEKGEKTEFFVRGREAWLVDVTKWPSDEGEE